MDREEKIRHKEKMFAIIEESQSSGLSNKVNCKQKGMCESRFYYWQKKCREEIYPSGFIAIRVNTIQETGHSVIKIAYPNGVIMRLLAQTPSDIIREYIRL